MQGHGIPLSLLSGCAIHFEFASFTVVARRSFALVTARRRKPFSPALNPAVGRSATSTPIRSNSFWMLMGTSIFTAKQKRMQDAHVREIKDFNHSPARTRNCSDFAPGSDFRNAYNSVSTTGWSAPSTCVSKHLQPDYFFHGRHEGATSTVSTAATAAGAAASAMLKNNQVSR